MNVYALFFTPIQVSMSKFELAYAVYPYHENSHCRVGTKVAMKSLGLSWYSYLCCTSTHQDSRLTFVIALFVELVLCFGSGNGDICLIHCLFSRFLALVTKQLTNFLLKDTEIQKFIVFIWARMIVYFDRVEKFGMWIDDQGILMLAMKLVEKRLKFVFASWVNVP